MIEHGITFDAYADMEGVTASSLKAGRVSMKHMQHYMTKGIADTPAMRKGRLIHQAILEPEMFFAEVVAWEGVKRGKAYTEFVEAQGQDAVVVTTTEMSELEQIHDSVHSNRHATDLITRTKHEVSMSWDDHMLGPGKGRMDGYDADTGLLLDLKSSACIEPWRFAATCYRMGTHIQMAWYKHGLKQLELPIERIIVIAVEQGAPFDCVVYEPEGVFIEKGWEEAEEIAKRYRAACVCERFGGVSGEILPLTLPAYAQAGNQDVELTIGGESVTV